MGGGRAGAGVRALAGSLRLSPGRRDRPGAAPCSRLSTHRMTCAGSFISGKSPNAATASITALRSAQLAVNMACTAACAAAPPASNAASSASPPSAALLHMLAPTAYRARRRQTQQVGSQHMWGSHEGPAGRRSAAAGTARGQARRAPRPRRPRACCCRRRSKARSRHPLSSCCRRRGQQQSCSKARQPPQRTDTHQPSHLAAPPQQTRALARCPAAAAAA